MVRIGVLIRRWRSRNFEGWVDCQEYDGPGGGRCWSGGDGECFFWCHSGVWLARAGGVNSEEKNWEWGVVGLDMEGGRHFVSGASRGACGRSGVVRLWFWQGWGSRFVVGDPEGVLCTNCICCVFCLATGAAQLRGEISYGWEWLCCYQVWW